MSKPLQKYYLLLSLIAILLPNQLFSQKGYGELYDLVIQENGDTLRVSRVQGDFWFGVTGGVSTSLYFGSLYLPVIPTTDLFPVDSTNPEVRLTGRSGTGAFVGILFEYNPPDARYGFTLRGNYENRSFSAKSDAYNIGGNDYSVETETSIKYFSISPSIRYNFYEIYYMFGGLDVDIFSKINKDHITTFSNPDPISVKRTLVNYLNVVNTRYLASFGLGLDYYVNDIDQGNRIFVSPFISVNFGTNIFSLDPKALQSPTLNSTTLKLGFSVKYGRDSKKADTLKLDTTGTVPTSVLVTAQIDDGVVFSGFQKQELVETANLSYVPDLNAGEQVSEEPVFAREMQKDTTLKQTKLVDKPKIDKIEVNKQQPFSFPSGEATKLDQKMKDYLTGIAEYLKLNPGTFVEIVGFSDNRGTPEQLRKRADDRANEAKRFLIGKGVNKEKVFARGNGSNNPVATNDTEEGRRKNRRIEIKIKKK